MDMDQLLLALVSAWPVAKYILMGLGVLVIAAQIIIPLTPSTSDDAAWAKIQAYPIVGSLLKAFLNFAPIHKK